MMLGQDDSGDTDDDLFLLWRLCSI